MAAPTRTAPALPPPADPIRILHFNELYGRPVHHYVLWGFILAALGAGVWILSGGLFAAKKMKVGDVVTPPTAITATLTPAPAGVTLKNTMAIAMVDARLLVTTTSGAKFRHSIMRIDAGAVLLIPWSEVRDSRGWPVDPKADPPVGIRLEAFGKGLDAAVGKLDG